MLPLIEINLLPIEDRKVKKDWSYLLNAKIVIPTILLVITGSTSLLGKSYFRNKTNELSRTLSSLQNDVTQNQIILGKIKELENLLMANNAKNKSLKSINVNKELWISLLQDFSKTLPPNTWVLDIRQDTDEKYLIIQGATHIFSEVALFMVNLEKQADFNEITLQNIEVDPTGKSSSFIFKLKAEVNLGLPQSLEVEKEST